MRKMLVVLLSSAAIGAGAFASATPAAAFAPIVVPLIIAAGIGGLGVGAVVASANQPMTVEVRRGQPVPAYTAYYDSDAEVLPAPGPGCTVSRRWSGTHWHSVEICS